MDRQGLDVEDLRAETGVSDPAIRKWLNGQTVNIRSSNIAGIARGIGRSEHWIETGRERDERTDGGGTGYIGLVGGSSVRELTSRERAALDNAITFLEKAKPSIDLLGELARELRHALGIEER